MSRRPKVLHILSDVFFSGAENMVCQIVEMFRGEIDMVYASPDGPIREALAARDVTFFPLKAVTPGEIRRAISAVQPDIVHAHDMKASVAAAAACGGVPLISHIHNNGFDSRKITPKTLLYHIASKKIRHIFWVSPSAMESYRFYGSVRQKSSVLRNVIDPQTLVQKAQQAQLQDNYDILFLGRMSEPKNPLRLVQVLNRVYAKKNDLNAAIVGKGDMQEQVKQAILDSPAREHIQMLGYQENAYGLLKRAKLMIMTSLWEGTPMCALEAMALGVPIVSTPVDGLCDLVEPGVTGFLEKEDEGLARRCLEILESPALRETLSKNTLEKARALLNLETYKQQLRLAYGFKEETE